MSQTALEAVRNTCLASLDNSKIKINHAGIRQFWQTVDLDLFGKLSEEHGVKFPLQFTDDAAELNVISVLALLNFLHGYRVYLHNATSRGAYDTIRYFIMAAHLAADEDSTKSPLAARGMADLSEEQTAQLLGVPLSSESSVPNLPGASLIKRDPEATEIVNLVKSVLNETGSILLRQGYMNLGQFVQKVLMNSHTKTADERAETLVRALVTTFPAFNDMGSVKGQQVCIYKKALFLVHALVATFQHKDRQSPAFPMPSSNSLPIFCDNIIPMMALHFKLLDTSACIYGQLKSINGQINTAERTEAVRLNAEEAYALRAATVAACEAAIAEAKTLAPQFKEKDPKRSEMLSKVLVVQLDGFLWSVAKVKIGDSDLRMLPRIAERGTVFY